MAEVYKAIPGFPRYKVSTFGNVLSQGRWGSPKILKKFNMKGRGNYSYVNLYADGKMHTVRVAVIVCKTFIGERPSAQHEAAHGNGIHNDDRLDNLRWATKIENAADRALHGTQVKGENVSLAKLNESAVRDIRSAKPVRGYVKILMSRYGVREATIHAVRTRRTWKHVD